MDSHKDAFIAEALELIESEKAWHVDDIIALADDHLLSEGRTPQQTPSVDAAKVELSLLHNLDRLDRVARAFEQAEQGILVMPVVTIAKLLKELRGVVDQDDEELWSFLQTATQMCLGMAKMEKERGEEEKKGPRKRTLPWLRDEAARDRKE